jgi:hypothetical protein
MGWVRLRGTHRVPTIALRRKASHRVAAAHGTDRRPECCCPAARYLTHNSLLAPSLHSDEGANSFGSAASRRLKQFVLGWYCPLAETCSNVRGAHDEPSSPRRHVHPGKQFLPLNILLVTSSISGMAEPSQMDVQPLVAFATHELPTTLVNVCGWVNSRSYKGSGV